MSARRNGPWSVGQEQAGRKSLAEEPVEKIEESQVAFEGEC